MWPSCGVGESHSDLGIREGSRRVMQMESSVRWHVTEGGDRMAKAEARRGPVCLQSSKKCAVHGVRADVKKGEKRK